MLSVPIPLRTCEPYRFCREGPRAVLAPLHCSPRLPPRCFAITLETHPSAYLCRRTEIPSANHPELIFCLPYHATLFSLSLSSSHCLPLLYFRFASPLLTFLRHTFAPSALKPQPQHPQLSQKLLHPIHHCPPATPTPLRSPRPIPKYRKPASLRTIPGPCNPTETVSTVLYFHFLVLCTLCCEGLGSSFVEEPTPAPNLAYKSRQREGKKGRGCVQGSDECGLNGRNARDARGKK